MTVEEFIVLPWAHIILELGGILSSKEVDQLILVNLLKQLFLPVAMDIDLRGCFLIEEGLDNLPDSGK